MGTIDELEFSFLHKGSLELTRTVPLILHVQSLYYLHLFLNNSSMTEARYEKLNY